MRSPEQTIEIKLNPTLQGLSRAVNTFTKSTEKHASDTGEAIDAAKKVAQTSTALFESLRDQLASRDDAVRRELAETRVAAAEASQTATVILSRINATAEASG